jgi:hypothetical protein
MESELFERVPVWDAAAQQTRYKLTDVPLGHTTDSREEFRAYSVHRTLDELETYLANQFVTYLAIACGGELRHIAQRLGGWHDVTLCKHTKCTKSCCEHICDLWFCKDNEPLPCGCTCAHKHKAKCKDKLKSCTADYCCAHKCTLSNGCVTRKDKFEVSPRINKYLQKWGGGDQTRSAGWNDWWQLAHGDLATWMAECAEAFFSECWGGGGFGGPKWGTAAALVADYLNGVVTTRLFLDRCWSLQHNGGCIFNKFYVMHTKTINGHNVHTLMHVLDQQSKDKYNHLCEQFASDYVAELWWEHQRATGKMGLFDVVKARSDRRRKGPKPGKKSPPSVVWPWEEGYGCMYCWYHLQWQGVNDPCGSSGGGWGATNDSCIYSTNYSEETVMQYAK